MKLLNKLLTVPSKRIVIFVTLGALIVFILLTVLMGQYDSMITGKSPYGVIDFEFAYTQTQAQKILNDWGSDLISIERFVTYLDFAYILSYVLLSAGVALLITRSLPERFQPIGLGFTALAPLAGVFDIVENIALLTMLDNPTSFAAPVPTLATVCATIKFGALLIAIGFVVVVVIGKIMRRIWWRNA